MREPEAAARDLSHRLMKLCDENVSYLRGAVAAATAISDLTFGEAEEKATLRAEHIGLRWALEECEAAVAALSEDLHAAHRLALEQAGGTLPPTSQPPCRAPAPRLSGAGHLNVRNSGRPSWAAFSFRAPPCRVPGAGAS